MADLGAAFSRLGYGVDVLTIHPDGPNRSRLPAAVRVLTIGKGRIIRAFPDLIRYLRRTRPRAMLSTITAANVVAALAVRTAGVPVRLVVREPSTLSIAALRGPTTKHRLLPWFVRATYGFADAVVAVSNGVAQDLADIARINPERISVIPNPVVTDDLRRMAAAPFTHDWFQAAEPPVIVSLGNLKPAKDHDTLIRAFARVVEKIPARLLILGEGSERSALESLVRQLGIAPFVDMPGFVDNPFPYLARAAVFVLSSAWEGSPGALVQALACGAPVVATDCASGPREILKDGRFGHLVPVGDVGALASGIRSMLDNPRPPAPAESWFPYSETSAVREYVRILELQGS
jgi:glycosyltransferase involved in cell wall biosynthesis